jgi:hypothetical protein
MTPRQKQPEQQSLLPKTEAEMELEREIELYEEWLKEQMENPDEPF